MKKTGILHAQLSRVIASMAHGEMLVIGDAGLPVPPGVETVDLALKEGVPGFLETLAAVLGELHVEEAIIDTEQEEVSPKMYADFTALWPAEIPLRKVPHAEFQEIAKNAKASVRTGEFTAYSNIILTAGVLF
ncbi:MAG TPA: D-ribose pyranase [Firmicutes bacterium]|nr:D-ribose pyranase [Bacillota bacterium]